MEGIDWQLSTISILFLTGLGWSLIYDLFTFTKPVKEKGQIRDFIFWLVSALVIIPVLFFANWGELRLYLWLSLTAGACCYRLLFRSPVVIFLKKIKRKIKGKRGFFKL